MENFIAQLGVTGRWRGARGVNEEEMIVHVNWSLVHSCDFADHTLYHRCLRDFHDWQNLPGSRAACVAKVDKKIMV
jgi:hypothetical protein